MRKLTSIRWVAILAVLGTLGGCASGPTIRVDKDPNVDVTRYRTFGFFEPLGTDRQGYESLLSQRLKEVTQSELEKHGYRFDQISPDLLVNFGARLSNRIQVTNVPAGFDTWGYYGYRRGLYRPWIGMNEQEVREYREGTLTIDLVDASEKQLVWQGMAEGRVTEETMSDVSAAVRTAVIDILAKLPSSRAR
jgi:hypothetical protein